MAFIPIPDVALFEMRYSWDGQRVENTLYFRYVAGWNASKLQTVAAALETWWSTNVRPLTAASAALVEIYGTYLGSSTGATFSHTSGLPLTGTKSSPSLPNNVTLALTFTTALRGRSYRGRNFFIGLCEDQVSDSTVNTTDGVNIANAYTALFTTATAQSITWVVASRFTNNAPRVTGVSNNVTGVRLADYFVDSMRRRLPGRGL